MYHFLTLQYKRYDVKFTFDLEDAQWLFCSFSKMDKTVYYLQLYYLAKLWQYSIPIMISVQACNNEFIQLRCYLFLFTFIILTQYTMILFIFMYISSQAQFQAFTRNKGIQ